MEQKLCECGCGQPTKIAKVTRTNRGHIKGQPMKILYRHGAPIPLEKRFLRKVNKNGPIPAHRPKLGKCWVWSGPTKGVRYPTMWDGERRVPASYVAIFLETNKWPILNVLHKCDNTFCVRPSHLYEGTHQENMKDMALKGRAGSLKLTDKQVLAIRREYRKGNTSHSKLAKKYDVSHVTIGRLIRGERRKYTIEKEIK